MEAVANIQRAMESEVAEIKRIENGKFYYMINTIGFCSEFRKVV